MAPITLILGPKIRCDRQEKCLEKLRTLGTENGKMVAEWPAGGASLARPWLCFHTPLIEPDWRIYRVAQPLLAFAPTEPAVRRYRSGLFRKDRRRRDGRLVHTPEVRQQGLPALCLALRLLQCGKNTELTIAFEQRQPITPPRRKLLPIELAALAKRIDHSPGSCEVARWCLRTMPEISSTPEADHAENVDSPDLHDGRGRAFHAARRFRDPRKRPAPDDGRRPTNAEDACPTEAGGLFSPPLRANGREPPSPERKPGKKDGARREGRPRMSTSRHCNGRADYQ